MPRKRPVASALREPLAWVLGTPAKVAALRAICGAGEPLSQRDVARRAGIQHRSAQLALDELVLLGLVLRQIGGRDYLVSLNPAHRLTAPLRALFSAEAGQFLELRQRLAAVAAAVPRRTGLVSVALFGSVARATDDPASDVDLLVVALTEPGLGVGLDAIRAAARDVQARFGCRLSPVGYTRSDAARAWRRRAPPFDQIRRDALVIFGSALDEALGDKN